MSKKWRALFAWLVGPMLCLACGPSLVNQIRLNDVGTFAADDCVAQHRRVKCEKAPTSAECAEATVRCRDAQRCVEAVQASVGETQRVQRLRATVGASASEETVAKMKQDGAVWECKPFGVGGKYAPKR